MIGRMAVLLTEWPSRDRAGGERKDLRKEEEGFMWKLSAFR